MIAGQQLPAGLGLATVLPTLDGETFSTAGYVLDYAAGKLRSLPGMAAQNRGLSTVGAYNYVTHPSFKLLCLSYDLRDGHGPRRWKAGDPPPTELFAFIATGALIEAHSSMFEYLWWNFHCVPRMGWPPLPMGQLRCSMAKCKASSYPASLDEAGRVLKIEHQKLEEGKKLIQLLTVPKAPTKKRAEWRWTPETKPEEFARLYDYCERDIVAEGEVSERVADLSPYELAIWQADQRINHRGMHLDRKAIEQCIVIFEQCVARGNAELCKITKGEVLNYSEGARIIAWLNRSGVPLYSVEEDAVTEMLEKQGERMHLQCKRVLTIRQELAFSSVKKLYAMRAQICDDDRLRDQYVFHGAHTGLWNGRGVQPANLYSGEFHAPAEVREALEIISAGSMEYVELIYGTGRAPEILANCLRSMIVAAPGCELISSDFTAIQAVVLACMAGEQWRIDVFRTHGKIYEASIANLTGVPFEEILAHKKQTGKHHPLRQTGKVAELSGGFGAWVTGWKKFGADKIIGDDEKIKQMILKWRVASPMIVEFWGGQTRGRFQTAQPEYFGLEGAAIKAVLEPGTCYAYRGVRFQMQEDTLYCQPPTNCNPIHYHAPRLAPSTRDYAEPWELELSYEGNNSNAAKGAQGWQRMKLYGGVLCQNVVSKVSRECQAQAILRLEAAGYPIVMHTHDEDVAEVPVGFGSIEEFERLMVPVGDCYRTPDGLPWPIAPNGGWRETMYGKWA